MIKLRHFALLFISSTILCGATAASARQRSIVIVDQVVPNDTSFLDVSFNFARNNGHAWIEYTTAWNDETSLDVRVLVSGLSYDKESKKIIFANGSERVVCANVQGPTWAAPLGETVKPTGQMRSE